MMADLFKRWRWALLIVALLGAGLGFAFWPEAVPVDAARVTRGPMRLGITDEGITRVRPLSVVSAPISGFLSRINLDPGAKVRAGQEIAHMHGRPSAPLDPRNIEQVHAALDAARASMTGLSATLAQARRDLVRAEDLAKRGFLPRAQLEAARTRVSTSNAALAQARAEVARLAAQLAPATGVASATEVPVRSPVAGTVLSVVDESEGLIQEGTPLMWIGDPTRIEVVLDLLSREAVRAKVGDPVEMTQWGGEGRLTGTVKRIEPFGRMKVSALGIEEQRVNLIIGFDAASAGRAARLGHGFQLDATVLLWQRPDALRVPIGALFRGPGGGWQVFAIEGDRARVRTRIRDVKIGQIDSSHGQVLTGLQEGDAVVLNPPTTVSDNTKVAPR